MTDIECFGHVLIRVMPGHSDWASGASKAYKQLPILKQALLDHRQKGQLEQVKDAA